jgi:DNA repair protein RadC
MRVYEAKLTYEATLFEVPVKAVDKPAAVVEYMKDIVESYPCNEVFYVIMLNRRNKALGRQLVTVGTATSSLCHPREVFKAAIIGGAVAIIVCHNHPGGDPSPSSADLAVTRQLREAARVLDIDLLDHVVLGRPEMDPAGKGYYSFREAGII